MNNSVNAFVRIDCGKLLDRSPKFDYWADLEYGNWRHSAGVVHISGRWLEVGQRAVMHANKADPGWVLE